MQFFLFALSHTTRVGFALGRLFSGKNSRMLRANSIENTFVLSARKVACRICAQYVQAMLFGNVVPESFQTNSCIGLTLRPQHRGHTLRKLLGLTFF